MLRIGFFNVKGYNNFKVTDYPSDKYIPKIVDGKQALEIENRTHLDVRNVPEFKSTGVMENSILIPLPELRGRTAELENKQNLLVNCRTGLRARFAWSILANAGVESTVLVDSNFLIIFRNRWYGQFGSQDGRIWRLIISCNNSIR